ncbi:MAG TPA: ATP-binding protein [Rhodopila sp.]|jgi:AAA+ superfamily predicted ATPase|nr:ATP-binding protein [Rhodopila sp.]
MVTMLEREIAWFEAALRARLAEHLEAEPVPDVLPPPPSIPRSGGGPYAALLRELDLNAAERLVLILALIPHLAPSLLDPFLLQNQATSRRLTEFGGFVGQSHAGFLPTVETALFLLAGRDRTQRLAAREMFTPEHPFRARGILAIEYRHREEPPTAAALCLARDYLERMLTGKVDTAPDGDDFPAERITTALDWNDLVLDSVARQQIEMIGRWIRHSDTLLRDWGLERRLKPGYRCLFHGAPGTGKTLTACLLGKHHGLPVYRVDLSRVVSKWIGETEKNLAALFDLAQRRNWILFFDEAESLFGKRTESRSANDRSANQQIAYLLQRLEEFPGVVILATNQRAHMDEAFLRRFQASVLFAMPDAASRQRLWESMFKTGLITLAPEVDFQELAVRYELAGGAILNVLRHTCLMAVVRNPPVVRLSDIMSGIRQEMQKEGQYFGG